MPNHQRHSFRALALTLSLLTVSACADTVPVSPTAVPAAPMDTAAVAPAAPAGPEAPAAAPAAQPQAAAVMLQGTASLSGEPFVGAQVSVLDAYSDATLAVGGEGLRLESAPGATDAQGGFRLALLGATAGQTLKVVAVKGDQRMESLVSVPAAPAAFRVLAEDALILDEVTTVEAAMAAGLIGTARSLTPAAAAPILAEALIKLKARRDVLRRTITLSKGLYPALTWSKAGEEADKQREASLNLVVSNSGIEKELSLDLVDGLIKLGKAAESPENRAKGGDAIAQGKKLPGLPLSVSLDAATGKWLVTNTRTGAKLDGASEASAITALVRKPKNRSGNTSGGLTPQGESKLAGSPGSIVGDTTITVGTFDDETHMTLTAADFAYVTDPTVSFHQSIPYFVHMLNLSYPTFECTFENAFAPGGGATQILARTPFTTRTFNFNAQNELESITGDPTYGTKVVDPERGALVAPPAGVSASRAFHYAERDGYVWNMFFDNSGLVAIVLTAGGSTVPVMSFTRVIGASRPNFGEVF